MKRLYAFIFVFVLWLIAPAHEFWLQPDRFRFQPGETAVIDFMVGEHFTGTFWDMERHRAEAVRWMTAGTDRDVTAQVKKQKGKNLEVTMPTAGTQLFALRSNAAYIEMASEKFDEYLAEDGIDNILNERRAHSSSAPVRELYTRCAKLLVQVGNRIDETFKRHAGHPLEIVPLQNPYSLTSGDYLDCRVLYNRAPLAHQKVKVWSFIGRRVFLQNIFTEKDGAIRFPISNRGPWMVSTVKMEKSANPQADYESLWATLVFGIE
jgi:uncharacterized GH25 family protein